MSLAGWVFDTLLALTLPVLALWVLMTRDLFKAVVVFIAFGLLASLAWARLGALDIALAEAAIGAGFTGALFLDTLGRISARDTTTTPPGAAREARASERTPATADSAPSLSARERGASTYGGKTGE